MEQATWDPGQYLRHADHRTRPFLDLLHRVPDPAGRPAHIADLGCGPGNVTRLLTDRWPDAHITGLDSSPDMLAEAARLAGPTPGGGSLDFRRADAADWTPERPYDLVVSNAALQWVPNHPDALPDWLDRLAPGGSFALQVPGNFGEPSHVLLDELCEAPRWRDRLAGHGRRRTGVLDPAGYLDLMAGPGRRVDAWETTYLHLLAGPDPVLSWTRGTALRPVLTALADDPRAVEEFTAEYRDLLRTAYPPGPHGTVLPFRRIFAVATRDPDPAAGRDVPAGRERGAAITALDHVQLAAPPGTEDLLRGYYRDALGMAEVAKPPVLAARGGCWFALGPVQLHLGVDPAFTPSAKAHPGLRVTGIDAVARRLLDHGADVTWDHHLPGHRRFTSHDPVGNRLEFLEPTG